MDTNTNHQVIKFDELVGKSDKLYFTAVSKNEGLAFDLLLLRDHSSQTATVQDIKGAPIKKITLKLRPKEGELGQFTLEKVPPFTFTVTRVAGNLLDIDWGDHPDARKLNRKASQGMGGPMGHYTIEEVSVERGSSKVNDEPAATLSNKRRER